MNSTYTSPVTYNEVEPGSSLLLQNNNDYAKRNNNPHDSSLLLQKVVLCSVFGMNSLFSLDVDSSVTHINKAIQYNEDSHFSSSSTFIEDIFREASLMKDERQNVPESFESYPVEKLLDIPYTTDNFIPFEDLQVVEFSFPKFDPENVIKDSPGLETPSKNLDTRF